MYDNYNDQYDPGEDQYEQQANFAYESRPYQQVPEKFKKFLVRFRHCINEGMLFEAQNLYESIFPKLSEECFNSNNWPDEMAVAHIVENDPVFLTLYKELYYRDIYAKNPGPSLEQRFGSFYNYCDLFNYILNSDAPVQLELPDQWLWELIDEFVYQFQSFTQYRSNLTNKSPEEIENLNTHNKVWDVLCVLNVLHYLVDKSKIKSQLEVYASGGDPDSVAGVFGRHSLYKMLGYFSIVGLLRLHTLLGDYYQAIKVLENVELYKKSAYSHVPGCQISTAYYVGFSYMMMRRYADAIRTFSSILLYVQRVKQSFVSKSYQNDQIKKQSEQMFHLLAICLALHPQSLDEGLNQVLHEKKYKEKTAKMQSGDLQEFESFFLFACPKFLSLVPPSPGTSNEDYTKEAAKHQTQVFMDEVMQQKQLLTIRSYLKLYTTLPMKKLANFMCSSGTDDKKQLAKKVSELTINLLCFKHKMKNIVWTKGASGLAGKFQSGSELDFYIDHDMIHIADTKVAHCYGDFFIRKILNFEEMNRKLHHIKI